MSVFYFHTQPCVSVLLPHTALCQCSTSTLSLVSVFYFHTQPCVSVLLSHSALCQCSTSTHSLVSVFYFHTQPCVSVLLPHSALCRCSTSTLSLVSVFYFHTQPCVSDSDGFSDGISFEFLTNHLHVQISSTGRETGGVQSACHGQLSRK